MTADPRQVDGHARRLVESVGDDAAFRSDPDAAVAAVFGIEVRYRPNVSSGCDIDGSYDHVERVITVDAGAVPARQRFTVLHELGHALGRDDPAFQDWLFQFATAGRAEEERVVNAFAGLILLPDDLVAEHIPADGPCAYDVQQLAEASSASREAACVRAAQKLRAPGMIVLSQGPVVQLAINRGLPFGIRRNTDMGMDSVFARASKHPTMRRSRERLRLQPSQVESSTLEVDAVTDALGYTFSVLMQQGAPWVNFTAAPSGPVGHDIECERCDRTRLSYKAECRVCGDRPCPDHGCSCATSRPARALRCGSCNMTLPVAAPANVDLCDMCG